MMKNVVDMSVGLLLYAAYGYSLTFTSLNPFMGGGSGILLLGDDVEYTHVLHQFSFAATTGTIVSGVLAERVSFKAYVVVSCWIISVLYSIAAHWAWTSEGWLNTIGFRDFAGAGIVHLLGGACAFVATCFVGPRTGRFGALPPLLLKWSLRRKRLRRWLAGPQFLGVTAESAAPPSSSSSSAVAAEASATTTTQTRTLRQKQLERIREAKEFRVSDPVNVIYGTFILYVGWISFNCSGTYGLTSGRENLAARVGVVTCIGGAAGTGAGLLHSFVSTKGKTFEIEPASVGALAGLVSITAACANIGIWEGAFAGFVGGVLGCSSRSWLEYLHIDDPVGAIPVHFVGGVWGLLVVGLFNRADGYGPSTLPGAFHGGGGRLLAIQLLGVLVLTAWGSVGTWIALRLMSCGMSLRVSKEDEKRGLDLTEHGVGLATKPGEGSAQSRGSTSRAWLRRRFRLRRGSSTPAAHVEEFVEDVGHAANVQAAVRTFALNLRDRAVAARTKVEGQEGAAAEEEGVEAVQISLQSSSSNELAVVAVGSP